MDGLLGNVLQGTTVQVDSTVLTFSAGLSGDGTGGGGSPSWVLSLLRPTVTLTKDGAPLYTFAPYGDPSAIRALVWGSALLLLLVFLVRALS